MSPSQTLPHLVASLALAVAGCLTPADAATSDDENENQTNAAAREDGKDAKPAPCASAALPLDTESACSDDAKFVYVLSTDGDLYRFDPGKVTITKLFPITCQSASSDPRLDFILSMA